MRSTKQSFERNGSWLVARSFAGGQQEELLIPTGAPPDADRVQFDAYLREYSDSDWVGYADGLAMPGVLAHRLDGSSEPAIIESIAVGDFQVGRDLAASRGLPGLEALILRQIRDADPPQLPNLAWAASVLELHTAAEHLEERLRGVVSAEGWLSDATNLNAAHSLALGILRIRGESAVAVRVLLLIIQGANQRAMVRAGNAIREILAGQVHADVRGVLVDAMKLQVEKEDPFAFLSALPCLAEEDQVVWSARLRKLVSSEDGRLRQAALEVLSTLCRRGSDLAFEIARECLQRAPLEWALPLLAQVPALVTADALFRFVDVGIRSDSPWIRHDALRLFRHLEAAPLISVLSDAVLDEPDPFLRRISEAYLSHLSLAAAVSRLDEGS